MSIVERPSYTSKDVEVTNLCSVVLFKLKKLAFDIESVWIYSCIAARTCTSAWGVLLYNDQKQQFALIEQLVL